METLKLRLLLILLTVLAGVVGLYILFDSDRDAAKAKKGLPLITIAADDVAKLVITHPQQPPIVIAKIEEAWNILEPIQDRANQEAVRDVINILGSIIGNLLLQETPTDLSQYGLNRRSAIVFSVTGKGGYTEELHLGQAVALDAENIYVLEERSGKVFRVFADVKNVLNKTVSDLRDRSVLMFEPEAVQRLTVETGRTVVSVRKTDGSWLLERPVSLPADGEVVRAALQRLAALEAADFPEGGANRGGEMPSAAHLFGVRLAFEDRETQRLVVGQEYRDGLRYARSSARGCLLGIREEVLARLPRTVGEFRERKALSYDPLRITAIDLVRDAEQVALERREEEWWITYPKEQKASDRIVSFALVSLREVRVKKFLDSLPAGISGRRRPWVELVLSEKEGETHRLKVLAPPEDIGELYVSSSLHEQPFTVSQDSLSGLPLTEFQLRDRRLLRLEAGSVGEVELRYPGRTIRLKKNDGQWRITKPRRRQAHNPTAWQIVFTLEAVTYDKVLQDEASSEEVRLFSDPVLEVVLWNEGGDEIGSVTFASFEGEGMLLATSSNLPGIYGVDARIMDGIPETVDELEYPR